MKQALEAAIGATCRELFKDHGAHIELTRPDEQFGDYAANVALQLAGQLHKNPREVAEAIAEKLRPQLTDQVRTVSVAGPGFINMTLTDQAMAVAAAAAPAARSGAYQGQTVVAEYSDANPFKVMHAGHVYTTVVGDAVALLLEKAGATVHRVNFGGDVGLHVGKTMWAILQNLGGEHPEKLNDVPQDQRAEWLAANYVAGNNAYEDNETARQQIVVLNKEVYRLLAEHDHTSPFAQIYWACRQWSYDAFDVFYGRFGTRLEKYYPESEVADLGIKTVRAHIGDVFELSDGAVVFKGEPYGLHTRVFINRHGLPTYEAKDVGLIMKKYEDYHFDRSVVITDNEQEQYMAVVLKAIEQFWPALAKATTHLPHGKLKLVGGVKMSSRKGNIIRAIEVLNMTAAALRDAGRQPDDAVMLGAIKYAFLRTRIGGDIIYDPKESIALDGNSGPYLQYAHARARSILKKSPAGEVRIKELEAGERSLARKIAEYPEIIEAAVAELMPHHICTYLYELAQTFNRFYEQNRVIGSERQAVRVRLVGNYADTLKAGLGLLGIAAPDTM